MKPCVKIESELILTFPEEKVSEAARREVAESALHNTRQSLADISSTVKTLCLRYFADTSWLLTNLNEVQVKYRAREDYLNSVVDCFFDRVDDYWTKDFFQKLGVCFLSELKQNVLAIRSHLKSSKEENEISPQLKILLRSYFSTLRSILRITSSRFIWDEIFTEHESTLSKTFYFKEQHFDPARIKKNIHQLSEFATSLACKSIADLQSTVNVQLKHRERKNLLQLKEILIRWVVNLDQLREKCGLPKLETIATNNHTAVNYFERMRILKKKHYKIWNLHLNLTTSNTKIQFLTGSIAAAVSATFAFFATYVFIIYQSGGRNISFSEMGSLALAIFAFVNVIVYVLKDRLKEWLKQKFSEKMSNNLDGTCSVIIDTDLSTNEEKMVDVATVSRSMKWVKSKGHWNFIINETFDILPDSVLANARIVKQKWIIPLNEIFESLDDMKDTLKIPTRAGKPVIRKLFKHSQFPYRLTVRVLNKVTEKDEMPSDTKTGKILTTGSKIHNVEQN